MLKPFISNPNMATKISINTMESGTESAAYPSGSHEVACSTW